MTEEIQEQPQEMEEPQVTEEIQETVENTDEVENTETEQTEYVDTNTENKDNDNTTTVLKPPQPPQVPPQVPPQPPQPPKIENTKIENTKLTKITKLKEFSQVAKDLIYQKQAIFFLNAMWKEFKEEAETIWKVVLTFQELDLKLFENGHSLDEFGSARLLEKYGTAMTVLQRRAALKEIDVDTDNKMSVLEYLVWKYKVNIDVLMERPQGTNVELEKAEEAVEKVRQEIKSIENKKIQLEKDSQGTGVKAKTAKNELEQLLKADQTELNRRIISAEAALRKAQKSGNLAAPGKGWWLQREVEEAKKYKPKGGMKHNF